MSRLLWIPVGAVSALVLSVFGCGGISGADGLFDSGSSGAGGAPATTSATGATSVTSSGATTSSATTTSSSATTGATTGASSSSASSSSAASSSAASSTSASSSSSTGGGTEAVSCGGAMCPLGAESACCWSKFATPASGACVQGTPDTDGCKTFTGTGNYQTRIECQTSAQCDQGVCCGHRTNFFQGGQQKFFYDLLSCVGTCDQNDVTICDPTDVTDVCPKIGSVQLVCKTSASLPPGYFVCGAP